ncbi:MAG: L-seryl-tRNA(Sec) selenium transferase [Mycobacteriaceae bacterium]
MTDARRAVPRTDSVLGDPQIADAIDRLGHAGVKRVVVEQLARVRAGDLAAHEVVGASLDALPTGSSELAPVLNATGILIHTNLGRAPLSRAAVESVVRAAGSTNVELDLTTGQRGSRGLGARSALAAAVPLAGDVHVVNNGAAALGLVTTMLARGRHIVIARGELVEIGDGFRIPDLLESFGAELRPVGTTNRVRFEDYAAAIDESVGFVLKVHPSNFRVVGFTSSVATAELARLPVPVVADIGSGLLAPHPRLPDEPDARTALKDGASLVTASGDKLLGGPQCGLILGRADLVAQLRRHPASRALRVDKLTLAALEATLTGPTPPVTAALAASVDSLYERACTVAKAIGEPAEAVRSIAQVGGGGAPGVDLPSAAVALPQRLAAALRSGAHPVLGRLHGDRLLLDLLAVAPGDDPHLIALVRRVLAT